MRSGNGVTSCMKKDLSGQHADGGCDGKVFLIRIMEKRQSLLDRASFESAIRRQIIQRLGVFHEFIQIPVGFVLVA